MSGEPSALLIVANSGRAMAESALRGGYAVAVLDGFCDRDTQALAPCKQLLDSAGRIDPELLLARAARIVPPSGDLGLVYGAGLENAPSALARLASRHRLFGNRAEVLDLLRDAKRFFGLLDALAIPHPEIRFAAPADCSGHWLSKQAGSSGGQRVGHWRDGQNPSGDRDYLQRHLEGPAMSVLFIADEMEFRIIGYNLLETLNEPCAERPFLYAGAISHAPLGPTARRSMERYTRALVRELGLRGVNSLDFVLHQGQPQVLELNARPSATLELYEQSATDGWVKKHVQACLGELPENLPQRVAGEVCGHRVCYAKRDVQVPHNVRWPRWAKDLPSAGSRIASGQPLCSVFARACDVAAVELRLRLRQRQVERMIARWRTRGPRGAEN